MKQGTTTAVFTRDTFTSGKLTFLLYCITFCYCEMHLTHLLNKFHVHFIIHLHVFEKNLISLKV